MRFSLAILATFVAAVSAQSVPDLPVCAMSCLIPQYLGACLVPTANNFDATAACVCASEDVQRALGECATAACSTADLAATSVALSDVCPETGSGSATDGGASGTAAATGSGTAAPTGSGAAGSGSSTPHSTTHASAGPSSTTKPGDGAATVGVSIAAVFGAVAAMML